MTAIRHPRRHTHEVHIGPSLKIGGDNPVVVQSMTNSSTMDTEASLRQCKDLAQAGCRLVRLTTQGEPEARNIGVIRRTLREQGVDVPLVADVHFNRLAAFEAARQVEKVRINPGNFADPGRVFKKIDYTDEEYATELQRIERLFGEFLDVCAANGTAIRLGVNHGSLSDRIMSRFGDTPAGMVESLMEYLRIARRKGFADIVLSIKASNVTVMVETVRLLARTMEAEGMTYPLHLGVTEAGDGEEARVKSAVGIGTLLLEGLGDTIRVSLSEDPVAEIPVARMLVDCVEHPREDCLHTVADAAPAPLAVMADDPAADYHADRRPDAFLTPDAKGSHPLLVADYGPDMPLDEVVIRASVDLGSRLLNGYRGGILVRAGALSPAHAVSLAYSILQACRLRVTRTEYIACPSCGRTLFDLQATLRQVKESTADLKGLKIAVMGCIVNGPGEMADADYGYVGAGPGRVSVYRGKECVHKNIPAAEALPALLKLIADDRADRRP